MQCKKRERGGQGREGENPCFHDLILYFQHPQIQKKTSKYIRYFCTENKNALDQWVMGIRIAKVPHLNFIFFK